MGQVLRHTLLWVVAVAMVASGATYGPCAAMQAAAAPPHHAHGGAAMHSNHGMHHEQAPAAPLAGDHGCLNCCSMCMTANAIPSAPTAEAVMFAALPVAFFRRHEHWSGNTIAVDPGIPKRIA